MTTTRYSIVAEIGAGSMGRVFEARDTRTGNAVAIKKLSAELGANPAAHRLLLDEAAVIVQLAHPHVVELLDVGSDDEGLFIVMELVRGSTLRAWSKKWPGVQPALDVFGDLLDALAAAHAQGIVHGDLKPGNVLLGAGNDAKLTDFGIARVIDPLRHGENRPIAGTPVFMAPEQVFAPDDVGPTTDLYAIGVMLRQLLGREERTSATTTAEILARKPDRLPPFAPRADIVAPPALAALLDALVDPDPRQRPRFAAQVRRELTRARHAIVESAASAEHAVAFAHGGTVVDQTIDTSMRTPQSVASSMHDVPPSSTPDALLRRLRPTPLVGRAKEIDAIHSLVRDATETSRARVLVIVGRAGEGKSRLARDGFAYVERAGLMIGAAASYDQTGAGANVDLRTCLRRLLGTPSPSGPAATLERAWRWFAHLMTPADLLEVHRWLSPETTVTESASGARVAARAIAAVSRLRPIYLWLDDVAWSRDGAMTLVSELLECEARVAIVATMRTGSTAHAREWLDHISAYERVSVMELGPLRRRDRIGLMDAVGPVEQKCAEVLATLLEQPALVIVEAVRDWIGEGLLVRTADGYIPKMGTSCEDLVAGVHGVLNRRLTAFFASFGPHAAVAEQSLMHAALLGDHFEERVLRAACGHDLETVLDRSVRYGMLRVEGNGVYRFDHALFSEALIARAERAPAARDLMRRTAEALEAEYGVMRPEAMMHAARLHRSAGETSRAYRAAYEGARALLRANAFDRAEVVIARMEQWADEDRTESGRAYVLWARGASAYERLDFALAIDLLRRARALVRERDVPVAARIASLEMAALFYADRFEESVAVAIELLADSTVSGEIRGSAHHQLAAVHCARLDLDAAITHQRGSIALAPTPFRRAACEVELVAMLALAGEVAAAVAVLEHLETTLSTSTRLDLLDYTAQPRAFLAMAQSDFAAARAVTQPWCESVVARGDRWTLTWARAFAAVCSAALDDDATAKRAAADAIEAYRAARNDELTVWWCLRATESFLRGRGMITDATAVCAFLDARRGELDAELARLTAW